MLAFRKELALMHNPASGNRDARMRRDESRSICGHSARLLPGSPKLDSSLANDSLAIVSWYLFERACFERGPVTAATVDLPKRFATQKLLGDLTLKFTAVGSVSRYGPFSKSPAHNQSESVHLSGIRRPLQSVRASCLLEEVDNGADTPISIRVRSFILNGGYFGAPFRIKLRTLILLK